MKSYCNPGAEPEESNLICFMKPAVSRNPSLQAGTHE